MNLEISGKATDGASIGSVRSAGDFAFDGDCCISYEVERTWTATDCTGNMSTTGTQVITIEGSSNFNDNSQESIFKISGRDILQESTSGDITITKLAPNPTVDQASISYILNEPTNIQIEVVDFRGYTVRSRVYRNLQQGVEYNYNINTERMLSGVYFIRMNSGKEIVLKKLVV